MDVRKEDLLKRNPVKGRSNGWNIKGKDTRGHNP
jgi:hypothetical protein